MRQEQFWRNRIMPEVGRGAWLAEPWCTWRFFNGFRGYCGSYESGDVRGY